MHLEPERSLISVIIPTYNRPERLARLLDSVGNLLCDENRIEVIVVDDASVDSLAVSNICNKNKVKLIRNKTRMFLAESRNVGIRNSCGEFLFFIDDDNLVDNLVLRQLLSVLKTNRSVGVAMPVAFYYSEKSKIWHNIVSDPLLSPLVRKKYSPLPADPIELVYFHNAFLVRRKVFDEIGLFDSLAFPIHLSELEFNQRMSKKRFRTLLVPDARVWHDVPTYNDRAKEMDKSRAFYLLRNRVALARRRSVKFFVAFSLLILPILMLYHLRIASENNDYKYFVVVARGALEGFRV